MSLTTAPALKLATLASVSRSINNASDQLSEQLSNIEKALNGYALGVCAWVDLPIDGSANSQVHRLGYDQHGNKWCLLWATGADEEETWDQKPLLESPREIRLLAVTVIPELAVALTEAAEKCAVKIAERAAAARVISASLATQ